LNIDMGEEPDTGAWFLAHLEIVRREEGQATVIARHILAREMVKQLDAMLDALIEAGLSGKITAEGRVAGRVESMRLADWLKWKQMPCELRRRAFDFLRDEIRSLEPGVPVIEGVWITLEAAPDDDSAAAPGGDRLPARRAKVGRPSLRTKIDAALGDMQKEGWTFFPRYTACNEVRRRITGSEAIARSLDDDTISKRILVIVRSGKNHR
jgi:hypothetical protein